MYDKPNEMSTIKILLKSTFISSLSLDFIHNITYFTFYVYDKVDHSIFSKVRVFYF